MVSVYYSNWVLQAEVVNFLAVLLYCPPIWFHGASETLFCFRGSPVRVVMVPVLVAVLQMRSRGKEELQVIYFQVVSLKSTGPGLYFPKRLMFMFKHIPIM